MILGVNLVGCNINLKSNDIRILSENGLPAISISKLAKEENKIKKGYNTIYNIESDSDKIKEVLLNGQAEICLISTDIAVKIYNETSNYQIAGSIGQGSYYLVTSDSTITGFDSSLINKEVAIIGENSIIDTTVKSILKENQVNESLINYKYVEDAPSLVTNLASGQVVTGIVPETSLATLLYKHSGLKILSSTNEAYEVAFNIDGGYPQFSVIVRKDFVDESKEYVDLFLSELEKSIDYANAEPLQTGAYAEELGVPVKPQVLSRAIERCNLKFISIKDYRNNYKNYFNNLYDYNKDAVGGTVPDESIYYK